jgi:hypothetical protein
VLDATDAPSSPRRETRRSESSPAAFLLNASARISVGCAIFLRIAYPARATMVEVFPEPAAATTRTRLSKQTVALVCSSVSGDFSTVRKKSASSPFSDSRNASLRRAAHSGKSVARQASTAPRLSARFPKGNAEKRGSVSAAIHAATSGRMRSSAAIVSWSTHVGRSITSCTWDHHKRAASPCLSAALSRAARCCRSSISERYAASTSRAERRERPVSTASVRCGRVTEIRFEP